MLRLLRLRDFRLLWLAGLVSMIGDWALVTALPFEVFRRTGSTLATAGVVLSSIIPQLLFGSAAGVFADRWDRRRLMVWVSVAQAAALLPLLLVDNIGIWIVYVVLFVATGLDQLFIPAEVAMLPRLVSEDQLVAANSLSALNRNLSRLIGPAIGGVLVAFGGLATTVIVDAISFLGTAVLISLISPNASFRAALDSTSEHIRAGGSVLRRLADEWRDGLRLVNASLVLRGLLLFGFITAIGEGVTGALFVPWVSVALRGDNTDYALLLSTQAVGGIIGAFVVARFLHNASPGKLLAYGALIFGAIDLVLFTYPLVVPIVWPALVGMVIVGIPTAAMGVGSTTLQQTQTTDSHRGRIVGLVMTVVAIGIIIGNVAGGLLGETVGIVQMLIIQGSGYVIGGAIVWYVTRRVAKQELADVPNALTVEPAASLAPDR